jgi:type IV secretion system protein VirB6
MTGFCAETSPDLGLVRGLLSNVDCNVSTASQIGYHAVSGTGSQLALALTALMTIYVAVFGLRLLLGMAPLRIGDLTVTALKLGLVLTLVTSWPVYQLLVYQTLFRGPEQLAASVMSAMQPPDSGLRGNPFDGLQIAYDQMQAAAAFFSRISQPTASPFVGGVPFAAFSLNLSSFIALFTTLGVVLAAKIVLGLLLALGPVFIALLLFDSTRGVFEGWLRASLAFAFVPLFATLALTVQLTLVEPHLLALADMISSGVPNLSAATAVFILAIVSSGVSLAGVVGIFIVATGFKLRWNASRQAAPAAGGRTSAVSPSGTVTAQTTHPLQPRVASVSAAAASLERRDRRIESIEAPHRFDLGSRAGADAGGGSRSGASGPSYRRSAQPRRTASSARRDR